MGGERGSLKRGSAKDVPKGCLAIHVGEEHTRFIVPLVYFNHPLFLELLKAAEEEYGFHHKGTITIPCPVDEFRCVQGMIHQERLHGQAHHAFVGCFRA